jgi:hypothetical protein
MLRIINELISEELIYWYAIIRPKNSPHGQNFVKEVYFLFFFHNSQASTATTTKNLSECRIQFLIFF